MAFKFLRCAGQLPHVFKSSLRKPQNKLCSSLSSSPSIQESILKKKLNQLVQWYEETTGMDEVRMAQKRVLDAEEKFICAQDRRRESNKEVVAVQNKLKDLYAELDNTTRGEDRYVTLITEEHKLLKLEKQVTSEFKRYEREEREHFSVLSSAVKESHEKERAQAERTKYWSIIGSIIGTIIGIVGSSINNELKMKELRKLIKESSVVQKSIDGVSGSPDVLLKYEKEFNAIASEMNASLKQNDDIVNKLNDVITVLDNKVKTKNPECVLNALSHQQLVLEKNLNEMKTILASQTANDPMNYNEHTSIHNHDKHSTVKMVLLSTIIVVFPIVFRYFNLFN